MHGSAKVCRVHRNTPFLWRHRFLALPNTQKATHLVGISRADETCFLESFKGKKYSMTRKPHKRGLSAKQIPVLSCRDRTGNTSGFVWEKAGKEYIDAVLKPLLASDTILCTDSARALGAVGA